jgi:hypothetical protein
MTPFCSLPLGCFSFSLPDTHGSTWLSTIPAECRANLMHYGRSVTGRLHPSHQAKQALTDGARHNHYLSWCQRISLPNPCTSSSPLQARNFILACYAVSLIRGETLKGVGYFIHHATLMGNIHQAIRCHTDRQLPSPRMGVPFDYIALIRGPQI